MTARDRGRRSEAPAGRARDRMPWMRTKARWLGLAALVGLGAFQFLSRRAQSEPIAEDTDASSES